MNSTCYKKLDTLSSIWRECLLKGCKIGQAFGVPGQHSKGYFLEGAGVRRLVEGFSEQLGNVFGWVVEGATLKGTKHQ